MGIKKHVCVCVFSLPSALSALSCLLPILHSSYSLYSSFHLSSSLSLSVSFALSTLLISHSPSLLSLLPSPPISLPPLHPSPHHFLLSPSFPFYSLSLPPPSTHFPSSLLNFVPSFSISYTLSSSLCAFFPRFPHSLTNEAPQKRDKNLVQLPWDTI